MLLRLYPDQVTLLWPIMRGALEIVHPPRYKDTPNRLTNMLRALIDGRLTCWSIVDLKEEDEEPILHGFIVTKPVYDEFSDCWDLVGISMYSFTNRITNPIWIDGLKTLCKYCTEKGYRDFLAFTDSRRVQKAFVEFAGGNAKVAQCQVDAKEGLRNLEKGD